MDKPHGIRLPEQPHSGMKILRASATSDFSVHPDTLIVPDPGRTGGAVQVGKHHWIPVIQWVRLHPVHESTGPDETSEFEEIPPSPFEQLDGTEQVVWVEKPIRQQKR